MQTEEKHLGYRVHGSWDCQPRWAAYFDCHEPVFSTLELAQKWSKWLLTKRLESYSPLYSNEVMNGALINGERVYLSKYSKDPSALINFHPIV